MSTVKNPDTLLTMYLLEQKEREKKKQKEKKLKTLAQRAAIKPLPPRRPQAAECLNFLSPTRRHSTFRRIFTTSA